jgi:elongation factor G
MRRSVVLCFTWTAQLRSPSSPSSQAPSRKLTGDEALNAKIPLIRNIGIVAHIDAGKTTTTERMLYYSGVTKRVGDVDSGTTTTDYMEEEMARGITITSAAVSLGWKDHNINLIDTPGHVDFTVEVERALRVVDGVVALFDASAGVQAQSYTVLRQAQKFGTPVIAFLNKMDKSNADFKKSLLSVESKLGVETLVLQIPLLGADGSFEGIIDVIEGCVLTFSGANGDTVTKVSVSEAAPHYVDSVAAARSQMLSQLTARDDVLSEKLIEALDAAEGDELGAEALLKAADIKAAIRRHVAIVPHNAQQYAKKRGPRQLVPILCGASRRNVGVQPLLDAVVSYLPSPADRTNLVGYAEDGSEVPLPAPSNFQTAPTIALAFKVIHQIGANGNLLPLVFFRVYSGKVSPRTRLTNNSHAQRKTELFEKLFVMHANNTVEIPVVSAGNIGAAFLPHTKTGDTLYAPPLLQRLYDRSNSGNDHGGKPDPTESELPVRTLEGISAPPPAISFSIESASARQIPLLDEALKALEKEDPSLRSSKNEFGQLIISGMGELHLEIILSRLEREYQVTCKLLRAVIEYREALVNRRVVNNVMLVHNELPIMEVDCVWEVDQGPPIKPEAHQVDTDDGLRDPVAVSPLATAFVEISDECRATLLHNAHEHTATGDFRSARDSAEKAAAEARAEYEMIRNSFQSAMEECSRSGPVATLPLIATRLVITRVTKRMPAFSEKILQPDVRAAIGEMLKKRLKVSDFRILEPMMAVEVHLTESTYVGAVVSSLNEKNAISVDMLEDGRSVAAVVPMRNIVRYTMDLRKTAKGNANFFTKLHHYRDVEDKALLQKILRNLGIAS